MTWRRRHKKGLPLHILKAGAESEIDAAFTTVIQLRGLVVGGDPFFSSRREQLVGLAARYAVPFRNCFTPLVGVLFTFPSRYWCT
jgi:hypothetical protein